MHTAPPPYQPANLLASLGAGGLAVSFYLPLLFLTSHPGQPVPTIDMLLAHAGQSAIGGFWLLPWLLTLGFAALHFFLLFWNIPRYRQYRSDNAARLSKGDGAFIRFAWPLLLAMSMNVGFIVALLTVPGFWTVIEYVFPFALAIFLGLGIFTVRQLARLFGEHLSTPTPLLEASNFSSLLPAFALGMITVGLSGPAAMSPLFPVSGIALFLATLFGVATLVIVFGVGPSALQRVASRGVSRDDSYGLMILVPISTILGIAAYRAIMALTHHFDVAVQEKLLFLFFSGLIAFQGFILWLGIAILRRNGGWQALFESSPPAAFALICPGVAFVVALEFFWGKGMASFSLPPALLGTGWLATGLIQLYVAYVLLQLLRRVIFTGASTDRMEAT